MGSSYYLYLLTFLGFPIIGFLLSRVIVLDGSKRYLKLFFIMFLIHNTLFLFGYSIKGDYADYIIFSLEYFYFCLVISLLYKSKTNFKVWRVIGTIILVLGFLQGLIGILMFIVISQDYESDKIYDFNFGNAAYQTRRYSFGFATLDDTRRTFETYKRYRYFPFEKKISKIDLFEIKDNLDFTDTIFRINIRDSVDRQLIEFSSTKGKKFTKTID